MDLINNENYTIQDYISMANYDLPSNYTTDFLDVSETISELAYLTHDYFRYYGKFPSKVAKYIISSLKGNESINAQKDFIFDNFNGSGTSLVEAKIAGFDSAGIDINPFGVLASNVKTYNYDISELQTLHNKLCNKIGLVLDVNEQSMFSDSEVGRDVLEQIADLNRQVYIDFPDILKWFDEDVIKELSTIKYYLLQLPKGKNREFFVLGFFAIIRRVSKAHDAEVRPHVNPKKKKRSAFAAFDKKITEMITTMQSWNSVTNNLTISKTFLCDNSDEHHVTSIIRQLEKGYSKKLGLVISHPPYLNCFDYIPVYRLKFLWAFGFNEIFGNLSYQQIKNDELRSYPATKDSFVRNYFRHILKSYKIIFDNLKNSGYCCVVIGDCTISKQLFSVHKILIKGMEDIGFSVEKVTYRSTAYGLGRYAYSHKADYNEKMNGKKDAIIFFKKP